MLKIIFNIIITGMLGLLLWAGTLIIGFSDHPNKPPEWISMLGLLGLVGLCVAHVWGVL